ncbi:type IX secretion system plug protein [Roseivirga misakiensis]|uniref:Type 9 secretion system plug protein N-terminal domain-containing protein n=1 Tax=Roseivirga misakiensis TaxID=1563681 RepID=A0A1E5T0M4_9BACT|nr:type IX secretion system plug protein domain-containing protein [Roseivirga misakiensis]OEK04924.1 hypothetical protein BFP71_15930 [Roseivirga misakiensis]
MTKIKLIFLLILLSSKITLAQKKLVYGDHVYENTIKTVQLYPQGSSIQASLTPAVKELNDGPNLVLEFDDLRDDADYFFVYFIHCNADWSVSKMKPTMYLKAFNEFEIENFEFSSESKTNYVHYTFQIPSFKESGNYLAVVYRDRNKEDIILSKRFSIYNNQVGVGGNIGRSSVVSKRQSHQRVEVTLNYGDLRTFDPAMDFTVVVRQNARPDNMKVDLKPTFIDENAKLIRYQNLGDENDFLGGNEFRLFDISTVNGSGRNVAKIAFEENKPVAQLRLDQERDPAFFQFLDINGQYYIRDLESLRTGTITAEYVEVEFLLDIPKITDDIYVLGAFNLWNRNEESILKYDPVKEQYSAKQLLKQGWYNYTYWVDGNEPNLIENSFFDTENLYEVFIYYRPMGARGDQLVGYSSIPFNNRR